MLLKPHSTAWRFDCAHGDHDTSSKNRNRSKGAGICKNLRLLRFHYVSSTLMLRLCCALKPLLCKSAASQGPASIDYQPSNKKHNIVIPVTMINLTIMNHLLVNFSIRAIVIINFEKLFLNFIADTMNWFQNSRSD